MSRMITVRMPEQLATSLDRLVHDGVFPTRAAALLAAVERLIAEEETRRIDRSIVDAYTRVPPTSLETRAARAAGRRSIASEPW